MVHVDNIQNTYLTTYITEFCRSGAHRTVCLVMDNDRIADPVLSSQIANKDIVNERQDTQLIQISQCFERATFQLYVAKCDLSKSKAGLKVTVREMMTGIIDLGYAGSFLLKNFKRACEKSLQSMEAAYKYLGDCLENEAIEKIRVTEEAAKGMHDTTQSFLKDFAKNAEKVNHAKQLISEEKVAAIRVKEINAIAQKDYNDKVRKLKEENDELHQRKYKQQKDIQYLQLRKKQIHESIQTLDDQMKQKLRDESMAYQQRRHSTRTRDMQQKRETNRLNIELTNEKFRHKIENETEKLTEKGIIYGAYRTQFAHDHSHYSDEVKKLEEKFTALINQEEVQCGIKTKSHNEECSRKLISLTSKYESDCKQNAEDYISRKSKLTKENEDMLSQIEIKKIQELDEIEKEHATLIQKQQRNVSTVLGRPRWTSCWATDVVHIDNEAVQTYEAKKDQATRKAQQKAELQTITNQDEIEKLHQIEKNEKKEIERKYEESKLAAKKHLVELTSAEMEIFNKERAKLNEEKDSLIRTAKGKWDSAQSSAELKTEAKLKETKDTDSHYAQQKRTWQNVHKTIPTSQHCESDEQTDKMFEENRSYLHSIQRNKQELCKEKDTLDEQIKEHLHELKLLENQVREYEVKNRQLRESCNSGLVTPKDFTEIPLLCTDQCAQELTKIKLLIEGVSRFWSEVREFCEDSIKNKLELQVKHIKTMKESSRQNVWSSQSFQKDASVFYNKWGNLKKMCEAAEKQLKNVLSIASDWNSNEISQDESEKIIKKYKESLL